MILICPGGDWTVPGMCGALTSTVIESSKTATGLLSWVLFPPLAYSPSTHGGFSAMQGRLQRKPSAN